MENRFNSSRAFWKAIAALFESILLLLTLLFAVVFCGCKKEFDYLPYVSELRSNVLLAKEENFTLRVYAVNKEYPYAADGVPHETAPRIEVYFTAPEGKENCRIYFTVDGKEYGGDMSYDNVKAAYFFSCGLDISTVEILPCRVEYGERTLSLNTTSIRQKDTLTAKEILKALQTVEGELFTSLTDQYGFAGEIHIRLIYEENPYYYIGVIDRSGKAHAFLLNAQTGKLLAKRTN